jgi:predicted site-specific integrase-resolvase
MTGTYSTAQVASEIQVDKSTLLRWLYHGKLPEPRKETFGGVVSRIWSAADLEQARKYRQEHYRKRS